MENTIGDGAIKVACIQCIPGFEWQVQKELNDSCINSDNIKDFTFLKGIGSFDLILIYWTKDFGSQLREAGPIKNILKSNLFLCYPYSYKSVKQIFSELKSNIFTSFCLLKISPGLKIVHPEIDKSLRLMMSNNENLSLLGSLGWNELILLFSSNEIKDIYTHLLKTSRLSCPSDKKELSAILKTLSFIGINYNVLPAYSLFEKDFLSVEKEINENPYFDHSIKTRKTDHSSLTIEISASIIHLKEIEYFFRLKDFKISYLVGKHDLLVKPINPDVKWSKFLAVLLFFRHSFKGKIFSTNTRLNFCNEMVTSDGISALPLVIEPFSFEYSNLKRIFGQAMASNLSNLFYTLNSLIQNPLTGSLYANMASYPDYVYQVGESIFKSGNDNQNFALVSGLVIRRGAELRSYGTYDTIEEVTGRFSEFKGGCQISLVALELIPNSILNSIDEDWYGFITVSGEPQFSHINEVLNVSSDSIWNPQRWWAIYHEIGHIIVERKVALAGQNLPIIESYLSKGPQYNYNDIIEFSAEIIGFEIGFFGNFELYLKLIWEYLNQLNPFQNFPLSKYAIRSFIVELFEEYFRKDTDAPRVDKKEFLDLDELYEKFISHMEKIELIIEKKIFPDKRFIAAENVKMLRDLHPFCEHLSNQLILLNILPQSIHLHSKNTIEIVDNLQQGKVWWERIDSPQAVLLHLFQEEDIKFNTKISTIMSFWNQQSMKNQALYHD